jgi:hypothetical protein
MSNGPGAISLELSVLDIAPVAARSSASSVATVVPFGSSSDAMMRRAVAEDQAAPREVGDSRELRLALAKRPWLSLV